MKKSKIAILFGVLLALVLSAGAFAELVVTYTTSEDMWSEYTILDTPERIADAEASSLITNGAFTQWGTTLGPADPWVFWRDTTAGWLERLQGALDVSPYRPGAMRSIGKHGDLKIGGAPDARPTKFPGIAAEANPESPLALASFPIAHYGHARSNTRQATGNGLCPFLEHVDRPSQRLSSPPQIRSLALTHSLQHDLHIWIIRMITRPGFRSIPLQPFISIPVILAAYECVDRLQTVLAPGLCILIMRREVVPCLPDRC